MKSAVLILLFAAPAFAQPAVATTEPDTDPPPPPEVVPPPPAPAPAPVIDRALLAQLVDERIAASPKTAGWKDGFFIQTGDGASKITIGGFTQFDGRFFVAD